MAKIRIIKGIKESAQRFIDRHKAIKEAENKFTTYGDLQTRKWELENYMEDNEVVDDAISEEFNNIDNEIAKARSEYADSQIRLKELEKQFQNIDDGKKDRINKESYIQDIIDAEMISRSKISDEIDPSEQIYDAKKGGTSIEVENPNDQPAQDGATDVDGDDTLATNDADESAPKSDPVTNDKSLNDMTDEEFEAMLLADDESDVDITSEALRKVRNGEKITEEEANLVNELSEFDKSSDRNLLDGQEIEYKGKRGVASVDENGDLMFNDKKIAGQEQEGISNRELGIREIKSQDTVADKIDSDATHRTSERRNKRGTADFIKSNKERALRNASEKKITSENKKILKELGHNSESVKKMGVRAANELAIVTKFDRLYEKAVKNGEMTRSDAITSMVDDGNTSGETFKKLKAEQENDVDEVEKEKAKIINDREQLSDIEKTLSNFAKEVEKHLNSGDITDANTNFTASFDKSGTVDSDNPAAHKKNSGIVSSALSQRVPTKLLEKLGNGDAKAGQKVIDDMRKLDKNRKNISKSLTPSKTNERVKNAKNTKTKKDTVTYSNVKNMTEDEYNAAVNKMIDDGVVEQKCKTSSKKKAANGLSTGIKAGGVWTIVKDLAGYPTHEDGGVDLVINRGGVFLNNNGKDVKAENGLSIENGDDPRKVRVKDENGVVKTYFTDTPEYAKLYNSGKLMTESVDDNGDAIYAAPPLREVTIERPSKGYISDDVDMARRFFKDYIGSQLYNERLVDMRGIDSDEAEKISSLRSNWISDVEFKIGDISSDYNNSDEMGSRNAGGKIFLDREADEKMMSRTVPRFKKNYPEAGDIKYGDLGTVAVHEASHMVGALPPMNKNGHFSRNYPTFTLSINEYKAISDRLKEDAHEKASKHNIRPEEIKAGMDEMRYRLWESDDIKFNPGKDKFDKSHYEYLKKQKQYPIERVLQLFDEDDFIWLMNNIADNSSGGGNSNDV